MSGSVKKFAVVVAVVVVAAVGGFVVGEFSVFGTKSETRNEQVVHSIERHEKVVLLGLGIQGIEEQRDSSTVFGKEIPGSGRAAFIKYTYRAQLGVDGENVTIKKTGENAFKVSIPEFIFIGHDGLDLEKVVEDNGVLSVVTGEIDELEMVNDVLNDEMKDQHVADNDDLLRDQAENFYSGIIKSIDPTITLEFDFA